MAAASEVEGTVVRAAVAAAEAVGTATRAAVTAEAEEQPVQQQQQLVPQPK